MLEVLLEFLHRSVLVYIDDILICSQAYHPGSKNERADAGSRIHTLDENIEHPVSILDSRLFVSPIQWNPEEVQASAPENPPPGYPPDR